MQLLDDRLGDCHAVEGAGASPDLIQDHQAARGGQAHDRCRFDHFDHERAAPRGNVVVGANARENAIDDPNVCRLGGHETAHLGHEDDERHLAQVGTFAGHVRAGEQHDPGVRAEHGGVGDELPRRQAVFHNGVAPVDDLQYVALVDEWPHVAVGAGAFGERDEQVEHGKCARRVGQR